MSAILIKLLLALLEYLIPGGIPVPEFIKQIIATIIMVIMVVMIAMTVLGLLGMFVSILWFGRHSVNENEYPRFPWASVWLRPVATIKAIANTNPTRGTMIIGTLYGAVLGLQLLTIWQPFFEIGYGWMLGFGVLGFSFLGMALVRASGQFIPMIAGMLGRTIGEQEARAAYAWSRIPALGCIVTWLPQLIVRRIFAFLPVGWFGGVPKELSMFFTGVNLTFLGLSALYLLVLTGTVSRRAEMRVEHEDEDIEIVFDE